MAAARTNILAVGTSVAASADQSVDSGASVTLELVASGSVPLDATVVVELKGSDDAYRAAPELELAGQGRRVVQIDGPLAAFRVRRLAGRVGVDKVA